VATQRGILFHHIVQVLALGLLAVLSACSAPQRLPAPTGTITPSASAAAPSATLAASTPAATAIPTSEPPATFQSAILRSGVSPVSYIADQCQYYALRWDSERSRPGTVVAPIMFHSIVPAGDTPSDAAHIDYPTFAAIIALAEELGFETITSQQLLGFLTANEKIPERSMILILDDRRPGTAEEYFLPINETNDWTTTLAWPIGDTTPALWAQIEEIYATGYFDVQSHGLEHNIYLNEAMSEDEIRTEIGGSIPILEDHFDQTPVAYIWPGGIYTDTGIRIAREVGFELGFTVHSRGPLAFNWIPQGAEELAYNDPLLLLPRFWSSAALLNLQQTAEVGDAAWAFAQANYAKEASWYAVNCGGELPPLP
jgi:peptidoglycan/xylan/chitin deacetylase (PgdA/CDA1 family)